MNRFSIAGLRTLVFVFVLSITGLAAAQDTLTPIEVGQNLFGEVTVDIPTARFALTVETSQTVQMQVLSLSSDYFPTLRVVSPNGVEILNAANTEQGLIVEAIVTLGEVGVYIFEVGGSGNTAGQFVLSVQPGEPLPSPVDLLYGQSLEESVDDETPIRLYRFESAAEEEVLLRVRRTTGEGSPIVTIREETAAGTLSTSALDVGGMTAITYRLAAGTTSYGVEIAHSGSADTESYQICLWTESTPGGCADDATSNVIVVSPTAQATTANSVPSATATGGVGCTVMSATGGSINVRRGPDTSYAVVGNLSGSQTAPVIGRLSNSAWYQISYNGQAAWVGSTVVALVGNCGSVPVVQAPALPTTAATTSPTQSGQPSATVMLTPTATLTAMLTATMQPTATATEPGVPPTLPMFEPVESRPDLTMPSVVVGENINPDGSRNAELPYFISVQMSNIGSSASGSYILRMCRPDRCFDYPYEPLFPGSSRYLRIDQSGAPAGTTQSYVFAIDFANDVNEADETNNLYNADLYYPP